MITKPQSNVSLQFHVQEAGPYARNLVVTIPATIVEALYQQAIDALQRTSHTYGFSRGQTPTHYIAHNFAVQLKRHIHDFCLNYFAIPFLYRAIQKNKLLVAGVPRLENAHIEPGQPASFTFYMASMPSLSLREWKYLPFKSPRRKQYKDLDRQAEQFIKSELECEKNRMAQSICVGDWVHLSLAPTHEDGSPLFGEHAESFWLKIGMDEIDKELHAPFLGKKIGDSLCIQNESLQAHFCNQSHIPLYFKITIADIIQDSFFCFEQFKRCFRLKSKKDVVQKLIEVFSYQHDISQRRAMAERSLHLLLSKNKFEIPHHIFLDQQDMVLQIVKHNPDYYVYRTQKDFQKRIEQLAKKQVMEMLILDQIAYQEEIEPTYNDIRSYFNLMKRPRTKEFIYFNPPITKLNGQESPLHQEEIARLCYREKTLNHIIHYLTRT